MMDSDEILSNLFRGARTRVHADGRDVQYKLPVEFLAAVNGATSRVKLPDGSALDVIVPAGTRDGQILHLRGKGEPGLGGGKPGTHWSRSTSSHTAFSRGKEMTFISPCRSASPRPFSALT